MTFDVHVYEIRMEVIFLTAVKRINDICCTCVCNEDGGYQECMMTSL